MNTEQHLDRRLLERFVSRETSRAENLAVVRHLIGGCPECKKAARALWYPDVYEQTKAQRNF